MSILISGTLAYDYIMDFPDSFKNHILPDQLHILNVCFVVEKLSREFGGTAGNIAYNMNLLAGNPLILATIGKDGQDYLDYFTGLDIKTDYVSISKDILTASAHITTDKDDNQITAFYNGAANKAINLSIKDVVEDIKFALVAPSGKDIMIKHAKECQEKQIPFCFDPGQQITALTPQDLMAAIGQAKFYIGNDYEIKMTEEKIGWDIKELLNHVEVVITTLGDKGSVISTKDQMIEVKACPVHSVEDPTGAGDAYRAGFFISYIQGHDLKTCGQVGSVVAAYAVEHYGTQNHKFTLDEFNQRYQETYGETILLEM